MTAELQKLIAETEELSEDELAILQAHIAGRLRKNTTSKTQLSDVLVSVPGAYKLTPDEAKTGLEDIFSSVELAEIETCLSSGELNNLPQLPKSLSEYINEDREDRF